MTSAYLTLVGWLAQVPFWEAKPPHEWTDEEIHRVLAASPWVKTVAVRTPGGSVPGVFVYLATARPIRAAEQELRRRRDPPAPEDPAPAEYEEFLGQNEGKYVVLAVRVDNPSALADAGQSRRMEQECVMIADRDRFRLVGHFPPTPSDPYLRLVFPRPARRDFRRLRFDLYLPTAVFPYRTVEFDVSELHYQGKPEY
ncbi:MAG: hypothetical protein RMK57_15695 [Bryobacterales bacterium]|nr:hypothetical protein [Bryobacteraceae bacterium]MDW8355965.1 hypothetical protein [Bryobacterales bacterium]